MQIQTKIYERSSVLSVADAIALMIGFGSFTATLIFGILNVTKNDKKK